MVGSTTDGPATGPGRWWYGLAAAVAVTTLVVTGIAGAARAVDLKDQVDGFEHFSGSAGTTVSIVAPGEYAVYHEWIERGGGNPYATGTPATEPTITVTAPDGSDVPVRPSSVSYGWGREQAEAVGTFDVTQPGQYQITAAGVEGRLAFGESVPGSPFYGFGGQLLAAGVVVAACVVGSLVVGSRRRAARRARLDGDPGPGRVEGVGGPAEPRTRAAVIVLGAVAVVMAVGVAILSTRDRGSDDASGAVQLEGASDVPGQQPATTLECTSDADFETGLCGLTPEELREINLDYADRLAFTGDRDAADAIAEQARAALVPLAEVLPYPSPAQVRDALAPISPDVVVSDNAVRTAGVAFGIAVDGGCVFGSVHDGTIEAEVGGYVNDGGCLAEYGH